MVQSAKKIKERLEILRQVSIFSETTEEVSKEIASVLVQVDFKKGEVIFTKGDRADAMYILENGEVQVIDGKHILATLGKNDIFGEFALVEKKSRTATVVAGRTSRLLRLDQEDFNRILDKSKGVIKGILKAFIKQILLKNELNVALQDREDELEAVNDTLDKRIKGRTKELSKANKDLSKALSEVERLKNRLSAENAYLQEEIKLVHNFEDIITSNKDFSKVLSRVEQVANTDAVVLVLGETGTGKELVARAIHDISSRRDRPLVKLNCAALPRELIESELFGHEKGAFTGAIETKIGRFELAHRGTIFLDEIGDMPIELQVRLLRVLQEGEFERVGNPKTMKVDVRVIAATNRNLEKAIANEEFREDLYYRLNVFPITIPSLRDRKDDIPLLVNHFIKKFTAKMGKTLNVVPQKTMETLYAYYWPGNIRELENIIERAVIISDGNRLELGDWFPKRESGGSVQMFQTIEEREREQILEALERTHWKVSGTNGAADLLGLKPTTLEARMKKLGISRIADPNIS